MKKPRNKSNNRGGKEKVLIETFTESVERIGGDTAFYGLVTILSFIGLTLGAGGLAVIGIAVAVLVMWNVQKIVNARIEEKKTKVALEKLKVIRGVSILSKHKEAKQIESSDKEEE